MICRGPGTRSSPTRTAGAERAARCATDGVRSHRARGLLSQPLIRSLTSEPSVRSAEVVEVLPLLEAVVEQVGVVDHDALEHPVELLLVDPMGALDLAVEPRSRRLDVDVADAGIEHVVVELRLELGTVVCLDHLNLEGQLLEDVVDELDRGLLVERVVEPKVE